MSTINILRGTGPTTITKKFYRDGTQADVGVVTVGIVDEDGNVIEAPGASTSKNGSGDTTTYDYSLAVQAEANRATVTWTAGTEALIDTLVLVGGWLFTESELREYYGSDLAETDADFTDAKLAEARNRITDEFERICQIAFVPTYRRETLAGAGGRLIEVDRGRINSIVKATVGGVNQTIADLVLDDTTAFIRHSSGFWSRATSTNPRNVVISYVHGHQQVPPDIKRVAMILARQQLVKDIKGAGVPETASSFTDATGQFVSFAANPTTGRWYGIPSVDTVLRDYSMRSPIDVV